MVDAPPAHPFRSHALLGNIGLLLLIASAVTTHRHAQAQSGASEQAGSKPRGSSEAHPTGDINRVQDDGPRNSATVDEKVRDNGARAGSPARGRVGAISEATAHAEVGDIFAERAAAQSAPARVVERRIETESGSGQRVLLVLKPIAGSTRVPPSTLELAELKLREVGRQAGYHLLSAEEGTTDEDTMVLTERPAAALFRQALAQGADRAIRVVLKVRGDRYRFELLVASLDGQGPLRARGHATPETLDQHMTALAERILPLADQWWGPALPQGEMRAHRADSLPPARAERLDTATTTKPESASATVNRVRFGLAVLYNGSVILSERIAHNSQMGARFDVDLNRHISTSVGVTYLNLKGRLGRAHSSALFGQAAFRSFEHARDGWSLPIKLQGGYVFANGGYVRGSLGFAMPLGNRLEWGVDFLAPTVWFVPGGPLISLDAATDLALKF